MTKKRHAATEHDVIAAEAQAPSAEDVVQVRDTDGVVHTLRKPEQCIVLDMAGGKPRFTIEHGPVIREQGSVSIASAKEQEDVAAAIAATVAFHVAQVARQHDITVIRVWIDESSQPVAGALKDAGFYVIELPR